MKCCRMKCKNYEPSPFPPSIIYIPYPYQIPKNTKHPSYNTNYNIPEWASSYVPTKQRYEFAPPHIAHTSPLSYAPPVPPRHPRARRCCNNCDCGCLLLLLFLGFLRSDPSRSTTTAAAKEKMEVYCLPFLILPWWCY
jgi:hypothetical protein